MEIIDTHMHLLNGKQFAYDWAAGNEVLKSQDFSLKHYNEIAVPAGITQAIFMETAVNAKFSQAEAIFANTIAEDNDTMVKGVIAGCFPEVKNGFDAWLAQTADAGYVGYRRVLHTEPDELSKSNVFIDNVKKIGAHHKCFDMCFAQRQLPLAIKLAKSCPDTQFILDHCGVPDIAGGDFNQWAMDILKLAELENVSCKISGILAYVPGSTDPIHSIKPYVEHCIESFGWNRVVWGGDWPVVNMASSLGEWVAISKHLMSKEDLTNQEKLFSKNTVSIYNL